MIGVGGTAFLASPNAVLGAFLFTIGLFVICVFKFALYTGMCGYAFDGKIGKNFIELLIVWIGNFIGCFTVAAMLRGGATALVEAAVLSCDAKLARPLGYAFLTAILCGALMYIAVDNFRKNDSPLGKYIGLFLCVPVFIISKLEHSIANMFFFSMAHGFAVFSADTLLFLFGVSLGNLAGGAGFALLRRISFAPDKS